MDQTIKIISFNLKRDGKFHRKNRWESRKYLIAHLIQNSGAQIVGVQELLPKMKEDLSRLLTGYRMIGEGRSRRFANEHSDILIKKDWAQVRFYNTFWLSKCPKKSGSRAFLAACPRICTLAEVVPAGQDQTIRVFNTHFDHVSLFARRLGMKLILKTISSLQKTDPLPTILMGDLNSKPHAKIIQMIQNHRHPFDNVRLHDVFFHAPVKSQEQLGERRSTYHGFRGRQKSGPIDYIFVSDRFQVLDASIQRDAVNGSYPSDHYPISATLALKESTPADA